MYRCPECGYISADNGECPSCGVPLVEVEEREVLDDEVLGNDKGYDNL